MKYDASLAALANLQNRKRSAERDLWALGDAILKDHAENDLSGFYAAAEAKGLADEISVTWLRNIVITARAFPKAERQAVSFRTHDCAGSPEMLREMLRRAGKKFLSLHLAEDLRPKIESDWLQREHEDRERQLEDARARKAKAVQDVQEARGREREAKTDRERQAAARAHERAREEGQEALREISELSGPKSGKSNRRRPQLVMVQRAIVDGRNARKLAQQTIAALEGRIGALDADDLAMLVEVWTGVMSETQTVLQLIRKRRQGDHLQAVS